MAGNTPRGLVYPTSDDKIKDGTSPSALADDFRVLADSADAQIAAAEGAAKSYADSGDTSTLNAAKSDATTKANTAESNAKSYADNRDAATLASAAADATAKANDAKWQRTLITDANTVTRAGTFPTGSSTANTPRAEGGELDHYHVAGGWDQGGHMQLWRSQLYAVQQYWRRKNAGVWEAWQQIAEKGDKGSTGATGATGPTGPGLTLSVGTVTTGQPGTAATALVRNVTGGQELDLTIPTGLPGTGTVEADEAVATYASSPGTQTHDYLHGEFSKLDRTQRLALADRILAWLSTEIANDRGDHNLMALLRRLRLRKTSADAPTVFEVDAADEQPQSTGAGIALQYVAEMAREFPERADAAKPIAMRIAETLMAMQCQNPTLPQFGGFMAAPGQVLYSALGTGQDVKGLLAAYEVWGVGQWLESAKRGGTFLLMLINPNPRYMSLYGHNVTDPGAGAAIICDRVGSSGQITVTSSAWSLVAVHALYRLSDVTGDESYREAGLPVRNFMATTLTGYYDYYATKATAESLAAGTATERFPLQSTGPQGTNAFQRSGDGAGSGTIESDSMEYALTALWHTGYNLTAIKTAYEHLTSLQHLTTSGPADFIADYNLQGRFTCWPGYFRINPNGDGVDYAFGGYYDSQGAGELLAFKKAHYPAHYEMSFDIIRAIIEPDRGALLTTGYQTLWSNNGDGTVFAVQGVIPIAVAGLGLIETTNHTDMEVTA